MDSPEVGWLGPRRPVVTMVALMTQFSSRTRVWLQEVGNENLEKPLSTSFHQHVINVCT